MEGSGLGAQVEFVGNYFPINYLYGGKGDISPPHQDCSRKSSHQGDLVVSGLGGYSRCPGRTGAATAGGPCTQGCSSGGPPLYFRVSFRAHPLYFRVSFRAHPLYFRVFFRAHPLYFRVSSRAHPLYPRVSFEAHLQYPRVYLGPSH